MSSGKSPNFHQTMQTVANVVSTFVAVAALLYSANTYRNTVRSNSENQARADWSNYLNLASSNHNFALPYRGSELSSFSQDEKLDLSYFYFRQRMIFYFDNILMDNNNEQWRLKIYNELLNHKKIYCAEMNMRTADPASPFKKQEPFIIGVNSPGLKTVAAEILRDCQGSAVPN